VRVNDCGRGATAYADAVATYLAFVLDKQADLCNTLNGWEPVAQCPRHLFARQAIPMVWDFAEGNPLGSSSGSWSVLLDNLMRSFYSPLMSHERLQNGAAKQLDATSADNSVRHPVIVTDPPYYDNIGYADLSDFFYVWLRRSLRGIYPELFETALVPKGQELVATPHRFGGDKERAQRFFEEGLGKAFARMREDQHPDYPLIVYYAFKQAESDDKSADDGGTAAAVSTGWESMLEGLLDAGLSITGTWPMRTEMGSRMAGQRTNANGPMLLRPPSR
jgi:putative DNA methylase